MSETHDSIDEGATSATAAPAARRLPAGRRGLLVRAGIVAGLLVVFVVLPGWIATRPAFMQRYSNLAAPYRTWSTSVHSTVPCQGCHVPPDVLSQAGFDARMVGEFYLTLLPGRGRLDLLRTPVSAACSACHFEERTVSPSGDLNIPHRAHVGVLKLPCVRCHAYLVHEKSPEGRHTPTMAGCLKCHDGRQAKNACSTCHTAKATPATHATPAWLVDHASHAKDPACVKCHAWTEHWCADCHARRPRSHGSDWRARHADAVLAHRDCEACHLSAFCVRCHGVLPPQNLDPKLTLVR